MNTNIPAIGNIYLCIKDFHLNQNKKPYILKNSTLKLFNISDPNSFNSYVLKTTYELILNDIYPRTLFNNELTNTEYFIPLTSKSSKLLFKNKL